MRLKRYHLKPALSACFFVNKDQGLITTAVARLDNRSELAHLLNILPADLPEISDNDLIHRAYIRWGTHAPAKIFGDWLFVAYHPAESRLFLARDHYGNTSLYYYVDQRILAFASSRQTLLDLNLVPIEIDELYLAQVLISWQAYHGERTIHSPILRLPPAHTLTVTPDNYVTRKYWYLEETPLLHLPNRNDYLSVFQELFNEAVRVRLRSDGDGDVAVSLSGGLDSSAVAVTAATLLRSEGKRLKAYISVPLSDTRLSDGRYMGNELPLAAITAKSTGNIDLYPVDVATVHLSKAYAACYRLHQNRLMPPEIFTGCCS